MTRRPSLDPAVAETRVAVRRWFADAHTATTAAPSSPPRIVVGLSGGADSLALVSAAVFEAERAGVVLQAVTVDHGLQDGSADTADRAAEQARSIGAEARVIRAVVKEDGEGPEAAARAARYAALRAAADDAGASAILLGHTLDDQAETVLLGLARGAGATSLAGMAPVRVDDGVTWGRPFLGLRRATTRAACAAAGIAPWEDPHNSDRRFARVRVRESVLPLLEADLGPGVAEALARTADQLREDAEAFAQMIDETIEDIVEHAEAGIAVSVAALAANPAAVRHRIIRHVVASEFHVSLTRSQTLEVARLAVDWSGQGPIDLPGCSASRVAGRVVFAARSV